MRGVKHLIECNCILPQFARQNDPPFHQFTVFSVIDDSDNVVPKFAQCPNCSSIHRVVDVCKSEIVPRREHASSVVTIDDIKVSVPKDLCDILQKYNVDVATWEQAQFILENQQFGEYILLGSEMIEGVRQGKRLRFLGQSLYKIESFSFTNIIG